MVAGDASMLTEPKFTDVVRALHDTLQALYGQEITALFLWVSPGATTFDMATNASVPQMIKSLREAADRMESEGVVLEDIGPRELQ
jgi:hypothetical protein